MQKSFIAEIEGRPGQPWLTRFLAGREEAEQWYLRKVGPSLPTAIEYRTALQRYMPELIPYYDAICAMVEGDGHPLDNSVAHEPDSPHFSLSFAGEAFFVVGLHPKASRPARRLSSPALVFNLHAQFEQLREAGRYEKLRSSILQRDEALAGSTNPMLARHGEISEARQYSGRAVTEDWLWPFRPRTANADTSNIR